MKKGARRMLGRNWSLKVLFIIAVSVMFWAGLARAQQVTTLVAKESTWKYNDTNTDLYSAGWPFVNDSGWSSGLAPLGFGTLNVGEIEFNTILTKGNPQYPCYYFRHTFTVADPSIYDSLTLRLLRDDGCVVYLNGTEVMRSNMPGGTISHDTWSSTYVEYTDETTYFEFSLDPAVLVAGDNILAVDVHQCETTSSDIGFDLELEAVEVDPESPYPPVLLSPADGATNVSTSPTLTVTVDDPQNDTLDVSFFGRSMASADEAFTIIVLPDTQYYAQYDPDIFTSQTQWIVDNKEALNIVFVIHEGDIVNVWDNTTQWNLANSSMSLLDGVVPYSVVPGDHDHDGEDPPGSTEYYEQYFPASRFSSYSWWGGSFAGNYGGNYNETYPHTNNNNYQLLTIGEQDYIFLSLDFCPSQDEIDWANAILTTYSDRMAILTTHALLDTNANYYGSGDFWLYPDGSSNDNGDTSLIWYDLIRNHKNLQLVLCGHMHGEARRTDDNVAGKPVHQLLANYQSRANSGNGWLRIMQFVPAEDTVYVQTYSPYLDQYETDADSEFSLYLPMGGSPFLLIGTDDHVPSGQDASILWNGLSKGTDYEWFVGVTDSTNKTTVGPVWSFMTALTPEASNPNPSDGATGVDINADLSWDPGIEAVSHDVYFGTTPTPGVDEFQGNQTSTIFDPGTMANNMTYYWRIDEVGPGGVVDGQVWSFMTEEDVPSLADSDIAVTGTIGGSYVDTHASDGVHETITERKSGGKPSNRYSQLEHKWTFSLNSGDLVTFYVEGHMTSSDDGDDFVFAYSTDDSTYTDMVTLTSTTDSLLSYQLPYMTSGTVYVRVQDTDRTAGNMTMDTISVDHMYIRSQGGGPPDATPPLPDPMTWASPPHATGSTSISMTATTASDPSGVEYYFDCTGGSGNDSGWQDSPSYEDTGLTPETQYTYCVQARDKSVNQNETVFSGPASATTNPQGVLPGQATSPNPPDDTTVDRKSVVMSWLAGTSATSHHVYLGTEPTLTSADFQGNQTETIYDPPGFLRKNIWYYWRIDEVNGNGTTPGAVWSFLAN